jgi:hypothetical protein
MLALAEYGTADDIVKNHIKLVGLIGKCSIVIEHVRMAFAAHLRGYMDGFGGGIDGK